MKVFLGNAFEEIEAIVGCSENPVIVTDPPFNTGYKYGRYKDRMPEEEYYEKMAWMFSLCPSVIVHYPEAMHRLSIAMGKAPDRVISWVYPSNTARQHRDVAFYGVKPDFKKVRQPYKNMNDKRVMELYKRTGGAKLYDWIECNQVKNVSKEKTAHPCQMPLSLMDKIVGVLPDGVTVIDPFAGSGTTLIACERRGIESVGIEMDNEYVGIIEDRASSL